MARCLALSRGYSLLLINRTETGVRGNLKRARAAFSRDRYFESVIENTIPDPNPNPNPNLRGYPRIEIPAHRITGI